MGLSLKYFSLMLRRHTLAAVLLLALPSVFAGEFPVAFTNGEMESAKYGIIDADGQPIGEIRLSLAGLNGPGGRENLKVIYHIVRLTAGPDGALVDAKSSYELVFESQTFDMRTRVDIYAGSQGDTRVSFTQTPEGVQVVSEGPTAKEDGKADRRLLTYDIEGPLVDQLALIYFIRALPLESGHTFSVTTINPARKGGVEWQKGMVLGSRQVPWGEGQVEAWVIETATADGVTTFHILPDDSHTLIRYRSARGETYLLLEDSGD